jgi:hypothetical protein
VGAEFQGLADVVQRWCRCRGSAEEVVHVQRCSRGGAVVVQMRWNKKGTTEVVQSWECRSRCAEVLSQRSEIGAKVVRVQWWCRFAEVEQRWWCRGAEVLSGCRGSWFCRGSAKVGCRVVVVGAPEVVQVQRRRGGGACAAEVGVQ